MDNTTNVEDNVEEPKEGMMFNTIDEVKEYYSRHSNKLGFFIRNRTSKKGDDGECIYVMFSCSRSGKARSISNKVFRRRPSLMSQIDCKARLCATLCPDGKWRVTSMLNDHNHELCPGKSRFRRSNRILRPFAKRRPKLNDRVGIKVDENSNSGVVEADCYKNVSFLEKYCRNYTDTGGRLRLGQGDTNSMQNYFMKMQANNFNFFYTMDFDDEGCLKNVFWADARSRAAYEEFGDAITFDTTYLTNKYALPLASFVGVNHHGQPMLLGCGLLSGGDSDTFTWLFQSWLACMSDRAPKAIITDQDKSIQKAIEVVFPNSRHRWCLWHTMKKLSGKLGEYKQYESVMFALQNVIYDSLTHDEFEKGWNRMIEKYNLQTVEWLLGFYDEHRWVPAFLKDTFWAGMSTAQRGERVHAFFDEFVDSRTT